VTSEHCAGRHRTVTQRRPPVGVGLRQVDLAEDDVEDAVEDLALVAMW
jgi:hypothetical protein